MKKVFVLLLFAILLPALMPGCSGLSKEKLRVGMECDYSPFNWTQTDNSNGAVAISNDSTGYAGGYDVQMAKKIADYLGMELEIVKTDWDGLIPALTSGKLDLIIAGMSPTDDRKEVIDFSDYYYESDLVIVVKAEGAYAGASSLADFNGAKITGQLNTTHYEVIDQIPGVNKQEALPDFSSMTNSLKSGFIDGYVSESPHAKNVSGVHGDLTYIEFEAGKGFSYDVNEANISIGMIKDSALKDKINQALAKISKEEREQLMIQAMADSEE
ncbi:MAG: transporter substrate-binding domain-containing protein [Oscillospiraceae bacterium]|nr:transporter substrate-binding domain-containing protein [Oscillospiraceae bacterium]